MITRSRFALLAGVLALAAACSDASQKQGSKLAGESTFDPTPEAGTEASLESQLKRWKGQSQFLTPSQSWGFGGAMPEGAASSRGADAVGAGARTVQESDIFKVGADGSKLLYLLNNYRGLQVVDFNAGADQPKLLGRVDATGNYPDDLYSDEAHKRLVSLENVYAAEDADYYDYSTQQSRLVVYDVADAAKPKIATTISLNGQISESRLVGDVLYVATSVRPSWEQREKNESGKGYVYSFRLGDTVETIETQELSAPLAWGNNMNVVEVKEGDAFKYYLVAVLSQTGWGWWDRQSLVEVVDISDAAGKIKPLMVVSAKGAVQERSQTSIKNNTLLITSNYLTADETIRRVAVESFTLPTATSEVIDATEAQFRKLAIERNVAKKEKELTAAGTSGDALADALKEYRAVQLADAEIGLKGRFVKETTASGSTALLKPVEDSVVTIGSTQGLSATVQDVRYEGDLLYVFWVPQNNIDPLDVFDISAPETVKHLGHLEFDGWIQRSIPLTYQGKPYILGLGWVIPSVDNEDQRRYPQAMLFSIEKTPAGRVRSEVLAQENLGSSNTWANFQAEDKMIEVRFTAEGQGAIMYTFSSWDSNSYTQGGKLIGFDLTQAAEHPADVFTEGGVLKGESSWLRRIFTNPEIDRVNTFSDESLGTFDVSGGIGAAGATIAATNVLELARSIQAYDTLKAGATTRGLQIISGYYWNEDGSTEIRLVDQTKADAEKSGTLAAAKINGSYISKLKLADDTILFLTQQNVRTPVDADHPWGGYRTRYATSLVKLTAEGVLSVQGETSWDYTYDWNSNQIRFGYEQKLVKLADGRVLATTGSLLKVITTSEAGVTAVDGTLTNCALEGVASAELETFEGRLYLSYGINVPDPARNGLNYSRNFIAPLTATAEALQCGTAINVPGKVLHVFGGSHIVTEDSRLIDIVEHTYQSTATETTRWYEVKSDNALTSLTLDPTAEFPLALLKDLYDPKNVAVSSMKIVGDQILFVESTSTPYNGWDFGPRRRWSPGSRYDQTENRLVTLGFDGDFDFTKTSYVLDLPGRTNASLREAFTTGEGTLLVIGQGRKIGLLAYDGAHRPTAKKLITTDANGERAEAKTMVDAGRNSGWYYYGSSGIHFSAAQKSLEIAEGLFGISQIWIAE